MSELPVYSETEVVHDTGRVSAADAPEGTGGVDSFRRSFGDESRNREGGVFGRAPEVQREEAVELESLSPDDALQVLGENIALRERVEEAEWEAESANEARLSDLAYGTYETSDEYAAVADELLEAGDTDDLWVLTQSWAERDPAGAAEWVAQAEHAATVATAQASQQAMHEAQAAVTSAYANALADFYAAHPDYQTGTAKNEMLAQSLAANPNIGASPEAFRQGLEAAREVAESVSAGALKAAEEMAFRNAFRAEASRSPRPPSADHTAEAAARRTEPSSPEELAAAIVARSKGTQGQRQAALRERNDRIRAEMARAARGSGFGEGAREQAARAIKAREEDPRGRHPGAF